MKPRPHDIHIIAIFVIAVLHCAVAFSATRHGYPVFKFTDEPIIIDELDTARYKRLGSLLFDLHQYSLNAVKESLEAGKLDIHTYTYGISHCYHQGWAGRLFSHLAYFQTDPNHDIAFEGFNQTKYQWPGQMQTENVLLSTNHQRKGRRIMNESFQALFPIYSIRRRDDYGSYKSFVLPFYDVGLTHYRFSFGQMKDSLIRRAREAGLQFDEKDVCTIHFRPIRPHHTLLKGEALVDSVNYRILGMYCQGRLDFAKLRGYYFFAPDSIHDDGTMAPFCSDFDIDYHIMTTRARSSYHTIYKYIEDVPLADIDVEQLPLDLTPYYTEEPLLADTISSLRPIALPTEIDTLLRSDKQLNVHSRPEHSRQRIEEIGETLINGTRFGKEDNRLRIYSPLDPASIGYDHTNGLTIMERLRYTHRFISGQWFYARGQLAYCFKPMEFHFNVYADWCYLPRRRGTLHIEARKRNSTFSSKFVEKINEALSGDEINFDSLGIDYYRYYEYELRHSIELTNGLMLHVGAISAYRDPVVHGVHKMPAERRSELLQSYYADLAPYIQLEWTPRQYYWYNNGYKEYVDSPLPTFRLEFMRAIPGVFNTDGNYGRFELDINQSFDVGRTRRIAYRIGTGEFFNQEGEYFINYRYFSSSAYPSSWQDDRIGGTFHLLDGYWYSSSADYLQMHFMYETPFGLCHMIRPIAPCVIKERLYAGTLVAQDKPIYHELGYGIDNNYFNLGMFIGFKGMDFYSVGFKFRIEIGRHI